MKNLKNTILIIASLFFMLTACTKMEDNYQQYLEKPQVYSPKVMNLTSWVQLRSAWLFWDNPEGNVARKIFIDYQDSTITSDSLINSYFLSNLEIKGYDVSVYTIDEFGNLSVPETISIFPNGE